MIEVEDLVDLSTEFADGNSTALKARFHRVDMRGTGPAAVLPMGFGLKWAKSDRKLLQAAYNLDAPSRFLEAGRRYFEGEPGVEFSQANSRSITWVSESSVDGFLGTGSQHQAVLSGLEECVC